MDYIYEYLADNKMHILCSTDHSEVICVKDEDIIKTPAPVMQMLRVATEKIAVKGLSFTQPVNCKSTRYIHIEVSDEDSADYYDLSFKVLHHLTNYLYGGYYEPLSERDKALADGISKLLADHKK